MTFPTISSSKLSIDVLASIEKASEVAVEVSSVTSDNVEGIGITVTLGSVSQFDFISIIGGGLLLVALGRDICWSPET